MSVSITLHCNRQWTHGRCAVSLPTGARSVDEALEVGRRQGWRTHSDGRDYCPGHSGRRTPQPSAPVVPLRPDRAPEVLRAPLPARSGATTTLPADTVRTASAHLKRLATLTDEEIAANAYWHSQHAPREAWFGHGIDNAVGGPAGHLAGLLSPANARFVAQLLDRNVTNNPDRPVLLHAEAFLLANNIVRSINR
ncbi:hypothetical protein OG824_31600 [Streptomyces prunicolor]|uniref:hypothetical protein n=1 Tax=Streptomyces prunicolor TaxID=67348 RepID=UPI0022520629|nr:hypothetical protein [Streptomyces prunicolor]MCX5239755.1 hypothetical protein [Streptomyces prunicolor]